MKKIYLSIAFSAVIFITACEKENNTPQQSEKMNYIQTVIVDNNNYMSGFKDLDIDEIKNDLAYIHPKWTFLKQHKNYVYTIEPENNKIYKYQRTDDDIVKIGAPLELTVGSMPTSMTIVSDTKAYIMSRGSGKVTIINPSTMELVKEIDLSEYAIGKENGDNNPEPISCIVRDGKLFVFLWQEIQQFYPNAGAHAVVIDMATDMPEKMISDMRATMLCPGEASAFVDEKGDIYVYATGAFGYYPDITEGFLRIKSGETEFDPDYYFPIKNLSIEGIEGNKADYIYTHEYTANGIVYGYINVPAAASPTPDYVNDKTFQPAKVDVYNKTVTKIDLPISAGWSACLTIASDEVILWGMATIEGVGYYHYNYQTDEDLNKIITTTGAPFAIKTFK